MLGKDVVTPEAEEDAFHVILFERREVPYDQKYVIDAAAADATNKTIPEAVMEDMEPIKGLGVRGGIMC